MSVVLPIVDDATNPDLVAAHGNGTYGGDDADYDDLGATDASVQRFADAVLENGRDKYGAEHTPLFVDGLHTTTLEPALWRRHDETWVLSNLASQQPLMRILDGITTLTGDAHEESPVGPGAGS